MKRRSALTDKISFSTETHNNLKLYTPNNMALNHMKQILAELKGEIPIHIIIMNVDSTHLSVTDRISRKKKSVHIRKYLRGFPGGAGVENLPANAGDTGLSPGLGTSHMPRSN